MIKAQWADTISNEEMLKSWGKRATFGKRNEKKGPVIRIRFKK